MGLQCSILGHAFEDAGVEREREEQGSEVVTTEREIERCHRCGTERVVSESTEVAAVVDAADVELDSGDTDDPDSENGAGGAETGGLVGAIERSGAIDSDDSSPTDREDDAGETTPEDAADTDSDPIEEREPDPEREDAEILTDETTPDRQPGQWPEDAGSEPDTAADEVGETPDLTEESLSGITVPEGDIVCSECGFRVEASSGYRKGDPCPDCNAWLEAERNQ